MGACQDSSIKNLRITMTYGVKLNRTSLRQCVMMMQCLLPALLLVWIDFCADEDWGPMCYPPRGTLRVSIPTAVTMQEV